MNNKKAALTLKSYLPISREELAEQAVKFISFMPGDSEVLFYYALLAVVKPYLVSKKIYPNFMLAIIAPSGHLKTTLARLYATWLQEEELQEMMFVDITRQSVLKEKIHELQGLNLIIDDMHEVSTNYQRNKQTDMLDYLSRHCDCRRYLANIIVTGEIMPSDIIFSCRDRMLQLSITTKNSEELKTLKSRVRELPENFMAQLAEEFSRVLSENKDSVQADIVSFYDNYIIPECFESTTRIASHMECMQVVEYLYRKYFCHMDEQLSRKTSFEEALLKHALHTYEASCIKRQKEESIDYVATIYEMLSENASSYVKGNGINKAYEPGDDNFLIENRKIYITGTALQMRLLKYLKRTVSMKQVSDALHDAGVLEEDCGARTKKFRGSRHYVIFRPALLAYYETKKNQEIQ